MSNIDRYTCEHVFGLLDEYVDKELTAVQITKVQEHLETCADCAGEYSFEAQVIQTIRAKVARIDCPESLRERVMIALL